MALLSKGRLSRMMLDHLLELTPGTKKVKDNVLFRLGSIAFLTSSRDINAAWNDTKKKAAKLHPDKFILDDRNTLHWNDGTIRILDKKISTANYKKLNDLAEKEGCTVNAVVTKLLRLHKKQK